MAKLSELEQLNTFVGKEVLPLAIDGSNKAASLSALKSYFKDSNLVIFDGIVDGNVAIIDGTPDISEGIIRIVYLTDHQMFVLEKTLNGYEPSYYSNFTSIEDYITDGAVRSDKVFFCEDDKALYIYDGLFRNIFDYIRIHAMTEEEFENLTNPIEGAFYATYEE